MFQNLLQMQCRQGNPNNSSAGDFCELRFVSQGTCRVNGADGWYYDQYSAEGQSITFCYNSSKVSIIELGGETDGLGPSTPIRRVAPMTTSH